MNISIELLIWLRFKFFSYIIKLYSKFFINQKIFKIGKFKFFTASETDSITNFLLKFNLWESKERKLIKNIHKNLHTIEAGGGIGTISLFLRDHIGPISKLIILEPNKKFVKLIKHNFEINNLSNSNNIILENALSHNETKDVLFHDFDLPFENKLNLDSYQFTKKTSKNFYVDTINIKKLLEIYKIDNFQLIIDVEGEEYNIINLSNQWLKKCKFIMFEAHHNQIKMRNIMNVLLENKFKLYKKNYNVYLFKNCLNN